MISSRIVAFLLLTLLFLVQPIYALPLTVTDPTKRAFTYDANGNLVTRQEALLWVPCWEPLGPD